MSGVCPQLPHGYGDDSRVEHSSPVVNGFYSFLHGQLLPYFFSERTVFKPPAALSLNGVTLYLARFSTPVGDISFSAAKL